MDNSYLHKKFKKQQCSEPKNHNVHGEKEVTPSVQNKENQNSETVLQQCGDEIVCSNSVPIHSTNNQTCLNLSTVPTYNSSLVKSSISDVGNLVERTEKSSWSTKENDVVNSQFSNNGISYVISNQNKNTFIKQPSFDTTKINDYESTLSTSSILENLYSKSNYVTSKLVNFIKAEDSSSNVDKNYYAETASIGECKNLEEKKDTQEGCPVPIDKGSSGKYVCNYCNLVCSKPSVLQKHIRAHTNERPFPCISCGFSFKTRSNLYKHCRSRTHANRVMGNKAQEITNEMDVDVQIKSEYMNHASPQNHNYEDVIVPREEQEEKRIVQDVKPKPYKPRFKAFFDGVSKENEIESNLKQTELMQATKTSNPHLLSLHINELIHKNNSIVNSNDAHLLRKRSVDNYYVDNVNNNEYPHHKYIENTYLSNSNSLNNDEPLNLTNKNRKRCLSEITEPTAQKSLIKELLLKNLYADTNKQCPYCKMIFQTVTELDLHKLRSCKGFTKSGARYSRSSSVNVASILTQNKNAFDTNPHVPNTVFPLKSPGPFLGKTRLVESDKAKSFSFDDGIQTTFQSSFQSPHDLLRTSQRYSLSPLTLQSEKTKKPPVKLFGGEVKITHTSGETKSFKIDGKDDPDNNFEYCNKLSENRVVKSTLQSGGTVLQNKPAYNKQDSLRSSPDIIRVYENTSVSPSIDIVNLEKTKFNFERQCQDSGDNSRRAEINMSSSENVSSSSYKYTNIMDFSQKAVKLLAPNLKQPNLAIPGLPIPNKFSVPLAVETKAEKPFEILSMKDTDLRMNISPIPVYTKEVETEKLSDFTSKHTWLDHRVTSEPLQSPKIYGSNVCTPMNLLVNGKVVRYVPGIPGPIVADAPLDMAYSSNIVATPPARNLRLQKPNIKVTPVDTTSFVVDNYTLKTSGDLRSVSTLEKNKSPKLEAKAESSPRAGEMRSPRSTSELKLPKVSDAKSPLVKSPNHQLPSSTETPRKFARPNSLALKPSMSVLKQHHGLTPTMFNQILISPDTPRVAKKYNHQILHGNYFSYLGLKSSTKSVYCTLNKTQPFYVPHFKKLSMYSEWRQQDNKSDKLYVSAYDSRQKQQKFTTAGKTNADLIVHSSYKFTISEIPAAKEEASKSILLGGYETNEEYTYVRGRGRGRYVCDQCGIRCKKPSMLKKHIRTHSNDRPYTCDHCNFSFKTKGNLTKHMKSKAHTKNSAANSSSSNSSAQQSGTPSSDSETDDSGMDSSDESTRQQEHEAAYGLLSLSQKPASNNLILPQNDRITNLPLQQQSTSISLVSSETPTSFMDTEQIAHMTKTNYAKNKILDQQTKRNFHPLKFCEVTMNVESEPPPDSEQLTLFLGKSNTNRPLTYPYMSVLPSEKSVQEDREWESGTTSITTPEKNELKSIKQFNVVKRYNMFQDYETENVYKESGKQTSKDEITGVMKSSTCSTLPTSNTNTNEKVAFLDSPQNVASDLRKRKVSMDNNFASKIQRNDSEVIDLSMSSSLINEKKLESQDKHNGFVRTNENASYTITPEYPHKLSSKVFLKNKISKYDRADLGDEYHERLVYGSKGEVGETLTTYVEDVNRRDENVDENVFKNKDSRMEGDANYVVHEQTSESPNSFKQVEYDNSAMETLADIATKQVKLEKNSLAKNVATEFLILATKNDYQNRDSNNFVSAGKDVNELIVKSEENKNCTICSKSFIKPSQLRLHMNIHYLERPFRCDSCSVSFRTKGHLQKHERSAGHHNKLSSSPTLSSSEPRPFKCSDCNIAFRIHGHLAKHLRSKMHIMKLECLAKIPFGLYAELERSNSLLTEINTTDGDQCLESLKMLAKKVFINDPSKLNQLGPSSIESVEADS